MTTKIEVIRESDDGSTSETVVEYHSSIVPVIGSNLKVGYTAYRVTGHFYYLEEVDGEMAAYERIRLFVK